jgi:hypothetical protein
MASKDLILLEQTYNEMYGNTVTDINTDVSSINQRVDDLGTEIKTADLNNPDTIKQLQLYLSEITNEFGQLYNHAVNTQGGGGEGQEAMIRQLTHVHTKLKEIKKDILGGAFRESVSANMLLITIHEAMNYMSSNLKLLL